MRMRMRMRRWIRMKDDEDEDGDEDEDENEEMEDGKMEALEPNQPYPPPKESFKDSREVKTLNDRLTLLKTTVDQDIGDWGSDQTYAPM
eukprot:2417694-Pyramimonas_sp.AAC.1